MPRGFGGPGTEISAAALAAECGAIRDAADMFLAGQSLANIAEEWTLRGFCITSQGRRLPITYARVRAVLSAPRIAGTIITEEKYREVMARLGTIGTGRPAYSGAPLTGGILTCGQCGSRLGYRRNARKTRRGFGYTQIQYVCTGDECSLSIDALGLESVVRDGLAVDLAAKWDAASVDTRRAMARRVWLEIIIAPAVRPHQAVSERVTMRPRVARDM